MPEAASARTLGPYLLEKQLKTSLPALLWSATHQPSGGRVMLWLPPPKLAADPAFMSRWREAGTVARAIDHPGLACVRGLEDINGTHVLVSEVVEGRRLSDVLRAGRTPPAKVPAILKQLLAALDAAHQKNALHGSLNPECIVLTPKGRLVIAGLGLPRPNGRERKLAGLDDRIITPYSAPEELRGERLSPRSDYYALGAILYHLLLGKPPYDPSNPQRMRGMIAGTQEPGRLRTLVTDAPVPLVRTISRLMSKAAKDRFMKADLVLRELEGPAGAAPPAPVDEVVASGYGIEEDLQADAGEELPEEEAPRGLPTWVIYTGAGTVVVLAAIVIFVMKTLAPPPPVAPPPKEKAPPPIAVTNPLPAENTGPTPPPLPTVDPVLLKLAKDEIAKARTAAADLALQEQYLKASQIYNDAIAKVREQGFESALGDEVVALMYLASMANRAYNAINQMKGSANPADAVPELETLRRMAAQEKDPPTREAWTKVFDGAFDMLKVIPLKRAYEELAQAWKTYQIPNAETVKRHYATLATQPESEWTKKAQEEGKAAYGRWTDKLKENLDLLNGREATAWLTRVQGAFGPAPWATDLPALADQVKKLNEP